MVDPLFVSEPELKMCEALILSRQNQDPLKALLEFTNMSYVRCIRAINILRQQGRI